MNGHEPHTVAAFLENRRLGRLSCGGFRLQRFDEPAEGHAAIELVLSRELGNVKNVGQRLFAAGAEDKSHVRARAVEQPRDRGGDRDAIAVCMQAAQQRQRLADRLEMSGER